MAEIVRLYEKNTDLRAAARVAAVLREGGVIIYPTGTTYALGCHALKERAVERICRLCGIDVKTHPLSIVCYDVSAVSRYAEVSTPVYKLLRRNLPGPFTFLLPALRKLPPVMRSRKGREVGIRMPDSPIVEALLEALDAPLMTASLPMPDDDPAYRTDPALIAETMGREVDLLVDGGEGRLSETTVVDCTGEEPVVVRQGEGRLA